MIITEYHKITTVKDALRILNPKLSYKQIYLPARWMDTQSDHKNQPNA